MLMCPCCFAKDIDPIILHYDEVDREYYCIKCVYHGSEADVRAFLADLQRHRYGVQIRR
jgi:hypothetical protein